MNEMNLPAATCRVSNFKSNGHCEEPRRLSGRRGSLTAKRLLRFARNDYFLLSFSLIQDLGFQW